MGNSPNTEKKKKHVRETQGYAHTKCVPNSYQASCSKPSFHVGSLLHCKYMILCPILWLQDLLSPSRCLLSSPSCSALITPPRDSTDIQVRAALLAIGLAAGVRVTSSRSSGAGSSGPSCPRGSSHLVPAKQRCPEADPAGCIQPSCQLFCLFPRSQSCSCLWGYPGHSTSLFFI